MTCRLLSLLLNLKKYEQKPPIFFPASFTGDMSTVSFSVQAFLKKQLLFLSRIPQTTRNHRPFSSHKLVFIPENKRLDKALRVLDIIAPKTGVAQKNHNHLRLIQDFLRTDSDQTFRKHLREDFIAQKSVEGVSCLFDDILIEKEDSDAKLKKFEVGVLSSAVSSCVSMRDFRGGIQFHCFSIISGFVANIYVGSSLITLYAKCGELQSAYKVFEEMPVRNVVTWTAVISGFALEWQIDVCLELYSSMRNSALEPNDFTFTSLLSACTGSGALGQGRGVHCQIIQMGFDSHLHISNALVSMYCKCGIVGDALYLFENTGGKDIVSWNSMIAGYAQHGLAAEAIELFEKMKTESVKPDAFTFLGVLSSCRHAGFVGAGRKYFNSMAEYGVKPELDHYSCLIDLLGRAGLLKEAGELIEKMPVSPNAIIWGTLLSACRLHGSVWIGIQAAENRLLLEPECAATHVQLANLYASVRCWDQAARVRKSMKDKGLKTNPGCSWIEIKNEVYRFRVEDKSTAKVGEILAVLDSLLDHMMNLGHGPEIQEALVNSN